ncbi:MAG: hypothetical protein M1820_004017 [Bogoriella megaspora]|nr:MAG: hypothetical protein M1820_004017 [Bogoriella megaspora]
MPDSTPIPILLQFFCSIEQQTGMPPQPLDAQPNGQTSEEQDHTPKKLPKGVVLGPDGKPCRSCTSFASWAQLTKGQTKNSSTAANPPVTSLQQPSDCPPDVEVLGRSTWTFLHSLTANYPSSPSTSQQTDARTFLSSFSRLYPCWVCAEDFQTWMSENKPRVSSRDEFGKWMCEAHNAVNVKLGKDSFDCGKWEERWRTGWKDGRCD